MSAPDTNHATGLASTCAPPCLSLYQPTHRHHPENQQDPILFGNLVKALQDSLEQRFPAEERQPLLQPFLELADNRDFWDHTLDGLAILGGKDTFRIYKLQRPVAALAVVADSFHVKPLIRTLQSADRYQVLGLSRHEVKLYEGNRDGLDAISLHPAVPASLSDALGEELTDPHLTVASYGGVGGSQAPMHHGHGGRKAEVDIDTERFFRIVDREVLKHHSQPSGLPLILAALPEHHHRFHEISKNPLLLPESIAIHPDSLPSIDDLRQRAWQLMEPRYLARLTDLVEAFGDARAKGLADDDPAQIARAVVSGRVATLLIEAQREVPGRINTETGDIEPGELSDSDANDMLDEMGSLTLKMGGQVVVIPAERMPTKTGIAAIYRY